MKKRIMYMLLAVVTVFGIMPLTGLSGSVHAASSYNLWVGGVQVTSENQNDILHDGTVSYTGNAASGTLKLENANISGSSQSITTVLYNIEAEDMDLEFDISGSCSLSGAKGGILMLRGSASFTGGGILNVASETYPVRINSAPIVLENVTITATGDTENFSTCTWGNGLTVNNADLSVTTRAFSLMIYGEFIMNGGSVTTRSNVSGITCQGKTTVNAGTIDAVGNTGYGFYSKTGIVINSGTAGITAKGGKNAITTADGDNPPEGVIELNGVVIQKPEGGRLNDANTSVCTSDGVTFATEAEIMPGGDTVHFEDVHEGDYFYTPVYWAVEKGITTGTSPTTFSPKAFCTRGQVVTFLWRAAGKPDPGTTENPFTDVKEGAFYYNAVLWAYKNGITTGTSPTEFSPDATCLRGQVVTFLWRAKGEKEPETTENPFIDVPATAFYYKPVLWAFENGITTGTSDTEFSPNDTCLRGQVVTFIYRTENPAV